MRFVDARESHILSMLMGAASLLQGTSIAQKSALCCALLSLLACRDAAEFQRDLTLSHAELDRGGDLSLVLTGTELPAAGACKLELEGSAYRPGAPRSAVHEQLRCRVIDREHVTADLAESSLAALAPTLFEGSLSVRLARSAGGAPFAHGRVASVAFRIAGESTRELALLRSAQRFQELLGIRELELTPSGLALIALAPDGPAAKARLVVGDVIQRVQGAPVELVTDFVADAQTSAVELVVVRQLGQRRQRFAVELALPGHARSRPWTVLLLTLGVVSGALLPALRRAAKPGKLAPRAAGLGLVLGLVGLTNALSLPIDLGALWMLPVLLHVVASARAYGRRTLSSTELSNEALALAMGSLGAAAFALGASHTFDRAPPWHWPLFVAPPAWLAAWVLARSRGAAEHAPAASVDRLTRLSENLLGYARAAVLAWFGLGALGVPGRTSPQELGWLALAFLFLLKLEFARWLLTKLQTISSSEWVALAAAVCAPLVSLAFRELLPPDTNFGPALGTLLFGFLAGRVARTTCARLVHTSRRHDPMLAPFP